MVSRLRQSAERSCWNVSGCSLSSVVPDREDTTSPTHRAARACPRALVAPDRRGRSRGRGGRRSSLCPVEAHLAHDRGHRLGPLTPRGDLGLAGCAGEALPPGTRQGRPGRLDEAGAGGDDAGWAEVAESGHWRGDGGAGGGRELVGRDWVEEVGR